MRLVLAGGTGFVGSHLTERLIEHGYDVTLISKPESRAKIRRSDKIKIIVADPLESLEHIHIEADILINAIGIIREFPKAGISFQNIHVNLVKNLIEFARANKISKLIQISALGVGPNGKTGYQQSKFTAEELIKSSGLQWVILRPSVIVGSGDHLRPMLGRMVKMLPFVPVLGDGQYKLQPVDISDLAAGIVKILDNKKAEGRIFEIGGAEKVTFDRMLDLIGKGLGKTKVRKIHQPVSMVKPIAALLGRFGWFPVTPEQITMLLEDNTTDDNGFFDLAGIRPKGASEIFSHDPK